MLQHHDVIKENADSTLNRCYKQIETTVKICELHGIRLFQEHMKTEVTPTSFYWCYDDSKDFDKEEDRDQFNYWIGLPGSDEERMKNSAVIKKLWDLRTLVKEEHNGN